MITDIIISLIDLVAVFALTISYYLKKPDERV